MGKITVWLPRAMDTDLRRLAKASGRSIGHFVQMALKETFGAGNLGSDTEEGE